MNEDHKNEIAHVEIRAEIRGLIAQSEANAYIMMQKLEMILEQTKRTNGRVSQLESDTDFIRLMKKYKWMFGLLLIGLYVLIKMVDLEQLKKMVL